MIVASDEEEEDAEENVLNKAVLEDKSDDEDKARASMGEFGDV